MNNNFFDLAALQKKWDSIPAHDKAQARTVAATIGGILMRVGIVMAIAVGCIFYFIVSVVFAGVKGKK